VKYDERSCSLSCDSSVPLDDASTAIPLASRCCEFHEKSGRRGALDARERAALTGVEHDDRQRRRHREQPLAELAERQLLDAEIDRGRARVAGVVEQHARLAARRAFGLDTGREPVDPLAQHLGRRVDDDVDAVGGIAAELGEQCADFSCVVFGVAQVGLTRAAGIAADDQRERRDGRVRRRCAARPGEPGSGETNGDDERSKHGIPRPLPSMTRDPGNLGM
jgi:hypothetical protein